MSNKELAEQDLSVEERVRRIVIEHGSCGEVEISDDTRLQEDLGQDDCDIIQIVMAIEEAFDIEIEDAVLSENNDPTLAEWIKIVEDRRR